MTAGTRILGTSRWSDVNGRSPSGFRRFDGVRGLYPSFGQ
jgi:hypothetical protein